MFLVVYLVVLLVFPLIHTFADRQPNRRTRFRVIEIWLLWFVGASGALSVLTGLGHIGPNAPSIADGIGFAHSPFQWEVGWADIAIGVIGFMSIWRRDSFMTAAVIALAILYWGTRPVTSCSSPPTTTPLRTMCSRSTPTFSSR